jgi:alpha-L-fucosidase 2
LRDGERAYALVLKALNPATDFAIRYDGGGGVYPNLFSASPPFQIDGNLGVTASIAEMLLQSRVGEVDLLPALPANWAEGSVQGLRARGGLEVDMEWARGRLTKVSVRSDSHGSCRLSYQNKSVDLKLRKGRSVTLNGNLQR